MITSMLRRAQLSGDGSTLSLDFTTGILDPRLTFTRSTSGTYIGADGLVKTATANTPRFDHDPTPIGTPRGLLIEVGATNLLKYSVYADTSWIAYGGYTKAYTTGITSPAGDTSAVRVTFDAVGKGLYTNNTQMGYTNSVGAAYTFSAWIRATSSTTNAKIRFGDSAVAAGPDIPISTTWTRYSYQYTAVANSGPSIQSASGTATGEFEMWGMQLETGSVSSYIPTGASQGNRAADSCVMTGTNFSSWFNATEGTFVAHARRSRTSDLGRIVSVNDNTASESIDIGASTTGQFIVTDGGSALATITPGTVTANTAFKIAGAFKLNDVQAALGGTLGTADSSVTMPTVNQLMIGQQAGASPVYLNGTVAMLKFWATRLPNDQLQALTT